MSSSKLSGLSMPNMALISTTVLNKSLSTMVKGIRGHKDKGELDYIAQCLAEIKAELSTPYADVKAQALQKLIYLQMIGYDISWASFNIVEVMSAPWFGHKRIGYLAASLCFTRDTDVILLTTHLFRKGFTQPPSLGNAAAEGLQYETGAAIACLSNIATPDLSMDLLNDVYTLMNSSRPYIRKKAVLVLLRLFKQWPKALRLSFDRLKDKLNDDHQGVVSAAVYVICELAAKNPKNYLSLAPQFFKILTTSSNNWVLIKVVKLLGSLSPLEPRLAKKLQEPLTDIITTTPAKSLLYECINTLLAGEIRSRSVIRLCLDKLRAFIEDPDQNLKYLGLLGLHRLMKKHPRAVAEHKDLILQCLGDEDITIRMRALDLITSMVSQRNVVGIVRKMMEHLQQSEGAYREHVLSRILSIGAQDNYSYISDFEWYISVLVDLTHLTGASVQNAVTITQQLTDVSIRVPAVRRYAVKAMSDVLLAGRLLSVGGGSNAMSEVLHAAAFIVGEYAEYVEEHLEVIRVMVRREVSSLSGETQNVFVQNVVKVLASGLYQPYDVSGEDQDVSLDVRVKDLLGRREVAEDEEKEDEGDEVKEESERAAERAAAKAGKEANDDVDPEQEEEELDANGVKKRKVKAKRRSYAEYLIFVGEMLECLYVHLPVFTRSPHVEVQERAVASHEFVVWLVQQAHMQPFISVPVVSRTRWSESKDGPAVGDKAAKKDSAPAAAVTDLLDDRSTASALSPRHVNGAAPPASLLSSLAIQVSLLFCERLNPVNPKAQRKVPVPKGLDLDAVLNPGWDVDSDRSEEEPSDSAEDEDEGARKRRRKDRKKEKDRERRRKKEGSGAGLFEEEDYSKPLTEAEKAEAKRRLEARRAAQAADPFYVKDRPSTSSSLLSSPTGDAAVQRLAPDDLPPLHVEAADKARRRKKHSRDRDDRDGSGSDDAGDLFAGVGQKAQAKVFKVKKVDDMPSGAESSDGGGEEDLNAPLGEDDVIPTVKPYGSEEREKKKKRKKEGRDDEGRRREKEHKKKNKHREGDKERKKERKADRKVGDDDDDEEHRRKKKREREKEKEKEGRDEDRERKRGDKSSASKGRAEEGEEKEGDRERKKERKRRS